MAFIRGLTDGSYLGRESTIRSRQIQTRNCPQDCGRSATTEPSRDVMIYEGYPERACRILTIDSRRNYGNYTSTPTGCMLRHAVAPIKNGRVASLARTRRTGLDLRSSTSVSWWAKFIAAVCIDLISGWRSLSSKLKVQIRVQSSTLHHVTPDNIS